MGKAQAFHPGDRGSHPVLPVFLDLVDLLRCCSGLCFPGVKIMNQINNSSARNLSARSLWEVR